MATKQKVVSKIASKGVKSPKAGTAKEYRNRILSTFRQHRSGKFTQPDFRKSLKMSNSYANKCLRRLIKDGLITRERTGNKYFYRLKK